MVLVDPYAEPVDSVNLALARGSRFLTVSGTEVRPVAEWLTVIDAPLGSYLANGTEPVDLVLSNSVLEHVGDVAATVPELARVTARGGRQFHFVDMRDHFFKYPFEMLCHSERVWRRWLNPGSNLNRLRAWDYERIFRASFPHVTVEALATDLPAFRAARPAHPARVPQRTRRARCGDPDLPAGVGRLSLRPARGFAAPGNAGSARRTARTAPCSPRRTRRARRGTEGGRAPSPQGTRSGTSARTARRRRCSSNSVMTGKPALSIRPSHGYCITYLPQPQAGSAVS